MRTESKERLKGAAVAGLTAITLMLAPRSVLADTKTVQHGVTLSVPTKLELTADAANFTLTFADFAKSSETDSKTVVYGLKGNNVTRLTSVLTGQLAALFPNIDFQADVGAFTKVSGNATIVEAGAGFRTIGAAAPLGLANKQVDSGTGKMVNGNLPITYKAVALNDLETGTFTQTLTISFIDT
ncbi:MAG: hypothetical protein FGM27_04775 [Candidatus Omnitrophica bacterium]|nr:hypothetical protein [Candidatus Omnitrophota bacterium]